MGLIAAKCFDKKWYEARQREYGQLSPNLLETANHAFEFLAELATRELPFVFKGGTCILLLVDDFRRLSIDVDIALPMSRDEMLPVLESIIPESRFLKVEPLDRDPFRLPKRHHYRFLYESVYTRQPGALLLDILEDDAH
ncbi:MAG: nucleotidyl transferase AbiEii/AbiGii toxin family protein [Candidatus Pacebacteria bacterium]|nr:nucleotidyl transferase AbiEii/AbiGii toxin family protein [Candidatus Paceibacterota bacterium]